MALEAGPIQGEGVKAHGGHGDRLWEKGLKPGSSWAGWEGWGWGTGDQEPKLGLGLCGWCMGCVFLRIPPAEENELFTDS